MFAYVIFIEKPTLKYSIMKKLIFLIFLLGISGSPVHALSLVYDGFLCQEGSYERSPWIGQSLMEVLSYKGDGLYELDITGGIVNIDKDPCINPSLGTTKNSGQTFEPAQSVLASAYFDGCLLYTSDAADEYNPV